MKNIPIIAVMVAAMIVLGFGLSLPIRVVISGYQPTGVQSPAAIIMCMVGALGFVASAFTLEDNLK